MEREKKECILEAATRAFERFGFRKTSVDEIARDAGVAKGTVYLAVESKEDLFYQAVHREVRGWVAELSKLIDPRRRADELLVEIAAASLRLISTKPLVRDLLTGICSGQLPGWIERLEELRALGRSNVEEILRLGIKQGIFQPALDVEMVARILQDLQVSGYVHATSEKSGLAGVQRRMEAGLDLVLNGLRARPAAARAEKGQAAERGHRADRRDDRS